MVTLDRTTAGATVALVAEAGAGEMVTDDSCTVGATVADVHVALAGAIAAFDSTTTGATVALEHAAAAGVIVSGAGGDTSLRNPTRDSTPYGFAYSSVAIAGVQ